MSPSPFPMTITITPRAPIIYSCQSMNILREKVKIHARNAGVLFKPNLMDIFCVNRRSVCECAYV